MSQEIESPDGVDSGSETLALKGLRVLEIGTGSGLAYAGKLFADFGAAVIKVEPPEGDAWRGMPPLLPPAARSQSESAVFAWLNTNKQSVTYKADLEEDRTWLKELAGSCDVVLDARALAEGAHVASTPVWMPADGDASGAGPIQVDISWFGDSGPYRGFQATESVCRSLAGAVHGSGPAEGPPHMPHEIQTGIVTGLVAFSVAIAGLIGRLDGSRRFKISIHEVVFGVVEMEAGMVFDHRHPMRRLGVNRFCGTHPAGIYETASGWVGLFIHTLPQWAALCEAIGRPELAVDPRFSNGQARMDLADEVDAIIVPALSTRTAQEWFELLSARKCPAVLVPTMEALLQQTVHRQRGAFAQICRDELQFEGPIVPLRLGAAGPLAQGSVPALGADNELFRQSQSMRSAAWLPCAPETRLPLAGIRIVDLSMGWAGPLAARTLADLGAEIIKVESTRYPDWWRGANLTQEFCQQRLYEKNANFNMMNRNKLSITLDLTKPEGKRLLLQLVQKADAVVENYSAEVMPKLGLDYPAMYAVNKRLVMLSMPAFGLGNEWSNTRAYGGTLEQASGLPLYTGHPEGPPAMTSYAYGDPIGGLNAGAALLLALLVQRNTGRGRHINLSQVESMLPLAAPYILEQSLYGRVSDRPGNRHPLYVPHGCYPCAGDDAWIMLSLSNNDRWPVLCSLLGQFDLASDPDLSTVNGRRAQQGKIDEAISQWTSRRGADEAMHQLQAVGIAAGVVRPISKVLEDPHLCARGFWQEVQRAYVGTYPASTALFRMGSEALPIRSVSPTLGQHTAQVLGSVLGLTPDQIDDLERHGITGTMVISKSAVAP